MKISLRHYAFAVLAITAVLSGLLVLNLWPGLRGGFGWQWPYEALNLSSGLILLSGLLLLTVYFAGAWFLRQRPLWLFLTWTVVGIIIVSTHFLWLYGHPFDILYRRTVSTMVTGGYMTAAEQVDSFANIQDWPNMMASGALGEHTHISISPPGWPTVYYFTAQALGRWPALSEAASMWLRPWLCDYAFVMAHTPAEITSAWLGILSPLWGALTAIPLYFLGRRLRDDQLGRLAAAGWILVPALIAFMATMNTPYPLLAICSVWFLVNGLLSSSTQRWRRGLWLGAAGLASAVCLFFNFALAPLVLWCGWLALAFWWLHPGQEKRAAWWRPLLDGLLYGTGLLLALGLYWLTTGHQLLALLPIAMDTHLTLDRPYLPWVWLHLWDFIFFVGLPLFLFFLYGSWKLDDRATRGFAIALLLALVTMAISGTARGETGRVWFFFAPGVLLAAAAVIQQGKRADLGLLLGAQLIWLTATVGVVRSVGIEIPPPIAYEAARALPLPTAVQPVNAAFGSDLLLTDYQAAYAAASGDLSLALRWAPQAPLNASFFFSAVVVDSDGTPIHTETWSPLNYQFPTTCWYGAAQAGGEPIIDRVDIELDQPPSGALWVSLSAFTVNEDDSPSYLPVTDAAGVVDERQIGLGPIPIGE